VGCGGGCGCAVDDNNEPKKQETIQAIKWR
jgi:hypothetical protein